MFIALGLAFAILAIACGELLVLLKTWIEVHITGGESSPIIVVAFLLLYVVVLAVIYKYTLARAVNRKRTN